MAYEINSTDLAGIGIGPFNLSVAALADGIGDLNTKFFDQKPAFSWHSGLAFDNSLMQTSYLKDLVTPVLPTSPWGFLNYLVRHDRFYDFMAARFDAVSRREFTGYMAWVAEQLPSCQFGSAIREVDHDGERFVLRTDAKQTIHARALSVGTGPVPYIPDYAPIGPDCFHGINYLDRKPDIAGKRVVVVGGGQTGAEIVLDLLTSENGPSDIVWLSRRSAFWHLQEGSLVDQIYAPAYHDAYRTLPPHVQQDVLAAQKYSSDGLTPATADEVYRLLYRRRHLDGQQTVSLRPARTLTDIRTGFGGFQLTARTAIGEIETVATDIVVLATGFRSAVPDCMNPLLHRLGTEPNGALQLGNAYRVDWDGPAGTPIYALNHGRRSHGIVDPQLSLTAWRSATILEDLVGMPLFDALRRPQPGLVDWISGGEAEEIRISA